MLSTNDTRKPKRRAKRRPCRRIPVTLWLLPDVYKRVVGVQNARRLKTTQDVFRDGFKIIEAITKQEGNGYEISLLARKGKKEFVIHFALDTVIH